MRTVIIDTSEMTEDDAMCVAESYCLLETKSGELIDMEEFCCPGLPKQIQFDVPDSECPELTQEQLQELLNAWVTDTLAEFHS
jgi:hypothetical protein